MRARLTKMSLQVSNNLTNCPGAGFLKRLTDYKPFLPALPDVETVLNVQPHVTSAWAKTSCITTLQRDGKEQRYFMKVRREVDTNPGFV